MFRKYDVIVVGAGPAGSLAAKTSAELGLKTLVFERGRYPGQKSVGGEFLPISIFQRFPWMKEGPVKRAINRWAFYHPYDDKLTQIKFSRKEEYGFVVHRPEWDRWVSTFAVKAGAHLKNSTLVEGVLFDDDENVIGIVTHKGEKYYSNIVIAADGSNSITAKKANLRVKWPKGSLSLCIKYTFSLKEKEITRRFSDENGTEIEVFYTDKVSTKGYGWVFPSQKDFCVGVGSTLDEMTDNMHQKLQNLICIPHIKEKVKGAKLIQCSTHTVPTYGLTGRTFRSGLILTGDAAGFVCPFDGAGYEAATISGSIAAEVAEKAFNTGDYSAKVLQEYEHRDM